MTATFILLANGFWELKDDLVCSKRKRRKDNEKVAEAGRLKEGWGEIDGVERGRASKEFLNRRGGVLDRYRNLPYPLVTSVIQP